MLLRIDRVAFAPVSANIIVTTTRRPLRESFVHVSLFDSRLHSVYFA